VKKCGHPKEQRSLLAGYDVVCGRCEQIIGRVALFPCAVLNVDQARALAAELTFEASTALGREARALLDQAVLSA
jgi:hypothetical protein